MTDEKHRHIKTICDKINECFGTPEPEFDPHDPEFQVWKDGKLMAMDPVLGTLHPVPSRGDES